MKLDKRQREWAVAAVVIVAAVGGVWWWGSQDPRAVPQGPVAGTSSAPAGKPGGAGPATTLKGVIAGIPDASTFYSYFVSTGVAAELGKGPYTVFVPTNGAFAAVGKGAISSLPAAAKRRLVEYHVVADKVLDAGALLSGTHQALSRDYLNFSSSLQTGESYVNSGKIIKQYRAQNGVIYVISSVLFPPLAR